MTETYQHACPRCGRFCANCSQKENPYLYVFLKMLLGLWFFISIGDFLSRENKLGSISLSLTILGLGVTVYFGIKALIWGADH